jgi:hypothetical protein
MHDYWLGHEDSSHDDVNRYRPRASHVPKKRASTSRHPSRRKIELDKLPDGRVSLKAMRPSGKIDSFLGLLAGKKEKVASLEEINEAAASGWAGKK